MRFSLPAPIGLLICSLFRFFHIFRFFRFFRFFAMPRVFRFCGGAGFDRCFRTDASSKFRTAMPRVGVEPTTR